MRISRVFVDGFGLFDGRFEMSLPGDIALVVGDNETGKSTLLKAIEAVLFGLESENEKAAFAPHGTPGPRSGSLEIETNSKRYSIYREFGSNRTRVELLGAANRVLFDGSAKPAGRTEEKEAYDALMRELIGIENADLFRNSALVEQNSLRPKMEDVVRRIVTGTSSADYAVALANLKETCDELTMETPWRRGKARKSRLIETLHANVREKKRTLSQIREAESTIAESRTRLDAVESELAAITDKLANQKAWKEALVSFSAALQEKSRVEGQLNSCRNELGEIEKLTEELRRCNERIDGEYSEYVSLPEQAETEIAGLARLKENRDEQEARYRQEERDVPRLTLPRFSAMACVAGLLIASLGVIIFGGILRIVIAVIGLAACAVSLFAAFSTLRSKKAAREGRLSEIREQSNLLKREAAEIERRYPLLGRMSAQDVLDELRSFKHLLQEKEKTETALKQHAPVEEIRSRYDSLSNDLVLISGKLEDLRSQRPRLEDVEREDRIGKAVEDAKAETLHLEEQHKSLDEERDGIRLKLAGAEARETLSGERLEEEIAESESELNRLKLSREAYFLAVETLEETISEFHSSHLSRIEQKTSDYLGQIKGTECRVRLSEELEPLGAEQEGLFFEPEQLSQGIRDQLYFALRIASAEEISGDARLPLLLDDPFVNFDEKRLEATLQILEKLSESHQVVLFTHDRRYCDWRQPAHVLER